MKKYKKVEIIASNNGDGAPNCSPCVCSACIEHKDNDSVVIQKKENWTIIEALDTVLQDAKRCHFSEHIWCHREAPLAFLRNKLSLTDFQVVAVAVLIESGDCVTWSSFAETIGCSRLSLITYATEMEDLITKGWVSRRYRYVDVRKIESFIVSPFVVDKLRNNEAFISEKLDGMSTQEFVDAAINNWSNKWSEFEDQEDWFNRVIIANPQLPLCDALIPYKNIHTRALFMINLIMYADATNPGEKEYLEFDMIDGLFPRDNGGYIMRHELRTNCHELIRDGYLEQECDGGIANPDHYVLTKKTKEELLSGYTPHRKRVKGERKHSKEMLYHEVIKEKHMFYNEGEQQQIERLCDLLKQNNLCNIQQRLEEEGMRKGFACLFYGEPGTGKTETVLQIARQTGRDIMQINIADMRDKYVGESEKNIKAVFSRYQKMCREYETMPILFFNEADGIFGKRTNIGEKNASVDKMENAMQNIILQEMETLEGILIATTNLTENLDSAFDRRFLFKVEFRKPDTDVKAKLWKSMIPDISANNARTLAERYDFSGGQIENIARKRTIEYILSGKHAGLSKIDEFCKAELLDRADKQMNTIGFRA